jgi:alkaline phosphatase D
MRAVRIPRRSLLVAAGLAAAPRAAWSQTLSPGTFTHGVASGDPLPDGVVLWTRCIGAEIVWEIAEDDAFSNIAQSGRAFASVTNDYCVKVDVRGLAPGRPYFYRFLSANAISAVGHTRTAPREGVDHPLRLALFSCANMGFGYFHAYAHAAARDDIDLVIHVGDYIYEMPRGRYPTEAESVPGRIVDPVRDLVALNDYYQRYASYHTDPGLLELRRTKPIVSVWDDHELVSNAWRGGAPFHSERHAGAFPDRIAAAAKAYFDWMPIRAPGGLRIFRHLDWGNLARIVLLDTRHFGRDQQIDYRRTLTPALAQGGREARAVIDEFRRTILDDPARTMLGATQEQWLMSTLAESKARGQRWQVIAQQVVMAPQNAPAEISQLLPSGTSSNTRRWFTAGEEAAARGLPWNLDTWSGYPAARRRLLEACKHHGTNAMILSGDSHNCWANQLELDGERVALEFAGGSVTSPGLERPLTNALPGEREAMMRLANPHLAWCDVTRRGYGALTFTQDDCEAEWIGFDDVRTAHPGTASRVPLATQPSNGHGPGPWEVG